MGGLLFRGAYPELTLTHAIPFHEPPRPPATCGQVPVPRARTRMREVTTPNLRRVARRRSRVALAARGLREENDNP